jgi:hypothetical protein
MKVRVTCYDGMESEVHHDLIIETQMFTPNDIELAYCRDWMGVDYEELPYTIRNVTEHRGLLTWHSYDDRDNLAIFIAEKEE